MDTHGCNGTEVLFLGSTGLPLTSASIHGNMEPVKHPTKTKEREKISMWFEKSALAWLRTHQVETGVPIVEFVRRAVDDAIEKAKARKK
jgi:hypothetical protein